MSQRSIFWFTSFLIILVTFVPASVLRIIGWDYTTLGGNPITKVHPATYLAIALTGFLMVFSWSERDLAGGRVRFVPLPIFTYVLCILAIFAFLTLFHGGGSIAFILDSLLLPAFIIILLRHLNVAQQATLFRIMVALFLVNMGIGVIESYVGKRLFPFTVQGIEVIYDKRPTALMGHPLTNAHLTAVMLFFMMGCLHAKAAKVLACGALAVGLLAFGGRSAMALFIVCYVVYLGVLFMKKAMERRLQWSDLALASGGMMLAPVLIVVVFALTPFGQNLLERLEWDDSAQSRLGLFGIFRYMDTYDLIVGIPLERFTTYLIMLNMPWTIENAWIQLLVRFGVIFFAVFLFGLYQLFRHLAEGQPLEGKFALVLFLLVASTNNSLTGKVNLLSVLAVLAITSKAYLSLKPDVRRIAYQGSATVQPA